jgi:hypothetical protein
VAKPSWRGLDSIPQEINKIMESLGIEKDRSPPIPDYSSHDESLFHDYLPEYN